MNWLRKIFGRVVTGPAVPPPFDPVADLKVLITEEVRAREQRQAAVTAACTRLAEDLETCRRRTGLPAYEFSHADTKVHVPLPGYGKPYKVWVDTRGHVHFDPPWAIERNRHETYEDGFRDMLAAVAKYQSVSPERPRDPPDPECELITEGVDPRGS